ncbi:MAG: T9SS type A sorting domain-containing protein [Flavobacteriales bacterium]
MRICLSVFAIFFSILSYSQCIQINLQIVSEPFCPGSFNGGQLYAEVTGGSGVYTYEWLNSSGGFLPGGEQLNDTTLSFLNLNQECWVYVTDVIQECTDSASYIFTSYSCQIDTAILEIYSPFDINPVGYNSYTECDIKLTNLGCQLQFKPEFIISHANEDLQQDDFIIEFKNAQSNWESIDYTINTNGQAVGFWGNQTGETLNCDEVRMRPVRVKFNQFNPSAPLGDYTATLRLWSVDENGDLLSIVTEQQQIFLTLIDTVCDQLIVNSNLTDASCAGQTDGQIQLVGSGGLQPYEFSFNNSGYSSNNTFTSLTNGFYYYSIKDAEGCQNSDSVYLNPAPVLPDSLWFTNLLPFEAIINWNINSLVDGYKFRYREVGQASWIAVVASGAYNNGLAEMLPNKQITGLSPITNYEVQVKTNSLSDCEEGWSVSHFFTTPLELYTYNVVQTCQGTNSGEIYFNIQSLNSYVFSWSGPNGFTSTDTSIYNLEAGDYNLIITNNASVVFDTTFSITVSSSSIGLTLNNDTSLITYSVIEDLYFTQVCNDNSFLIADSGFTNYSWTFGETGQQLLIDTTNVFVRVQATDSNNCITYSDSVYVIMISDYVELMQANTNEQYLQSSYTFCSQDSSLEIDISPFESSSYLINWRQVIGQNSVVIGSSSTIEIFPTQTSDYILEIATCFFDFTINYYQNPVLQLQNTDLLCFGDSDASIIMFADSTSSTAHFVLTDSTNTVLLDSISNQLVDTIAGLSAGQYTVEFIDQWQCTTEQEVNILQPEQIRFDSVYVQNIYCNGEGFGHIYFKLEGGILPYTITLDSIAISQTPNPDGFYLIENLPPGTFLLEVVDDNNCYFSYTFEIVESPLLVFSLDSFEDTISCFGDSTAFIQLSASGGTPEYTFQLIQNNNLLTQQSSDFFGNLSVGVYEVIVNDFYLCADTVQLEIVQNQELIISENIAAHQNNLCFDDMEGVIDLSVSGGVSPYTLTVLAGVVQFDYPHLFDSLATGFYTFQVTDSIGCINQTDSIEISSPQPLVLNTLSTVDPSCQLAFGTGIFEVFGGTPTYDFELNDSSINVNVTNNGSFNLTNLQSDTFHLQVIDANLCIDSVEFFIGSQSTFDFLLDSYTDTLLCYGDTNGIAIVSAVDETPPSTYFIYRNDTLLYSQSDTLFSNLSYGDYQINIVDSEACADYVQFTIHQNPQLVLQEDIAFHQDVLCNGLGLGQVSIDITGGVPSYTIGLLNDVMFNYPHVFTGLDLGSYTIVATDIHGCTGQTTTEIITNPLSPDLNEVSIQPIDCQTLYGSAIFEISTSIAPPFIFTLNDQVIPVALDNNNQFTLDFLSDTTYTLKVEDNNLCFDTATFSINNTVIIDLEILNHSDTLQCYGDTTGFIFSQVINGVFPCSYVLIKETDTIAQQDSANFYNLSAGTYELVVTDDLGCSSAEQIIIEENELIQVSDSLGFHFDVSCYGFNDGQFMPHVSGGMAPYTYDFSDSIQTFQHPFLFQNLFANTYEFDVIDALGCIQPYSINISQPDSLYIDSLILSDIICHGDSTGMIEYILGGGTPPFNYLINSDSTILSTALTVGNYQIEIIDSNQCAVDTNFVINEPPILQLSVVDTLTFDVSCFGNNDGQIGLSASGGVPPYEYRINGAVYDTNIIIDLLADTFIVSVIDSIGCEITQEVVITQPSQNIFISNYTLSDSLGYCALCYGDSTGSISIDAIGGTLPYRYFMVSSPDTFYSLPIEQLVGSTEYEFYVKDTLGCVSDTISVECTSSDEILMTLDLVNSPICCYSCDASVNLSASGGISPYQYGINNQSYQLNTLFDEMCGDTSYAFKVLDNLGCEKIDSIVVPNIPCLTVDTVNFINPNYPAVISDSCQVDGTAQIYATANNGSGNYFFSIGDTSDFIQSQTFLFEDLSPMSEYIIFVKDEMNCIDSINVTIPEITPITIQLVFDSVICASPFIDVVSLQSDTPAFNVQAFGSFSNTYSYSIDQFDSTNFLNSGEFINLDTTFYTLNVKDGFNCITEFDINIPSITVDYDYTIYDISCAGNNDGLVQVNTLSSDQVSPWFEVDNIQPSSNIVSNMGEGLHEITFQYLFPDGSGVCTHSEFFDFVDKEELNVTLLKEDVSCYGNCDGIITIDSTSGGTLPYVFVNMNSLDTNSIFEDLCAGQYAIKLIDANGCYLIENLSISEGNTIYPIIDYENGNLVVQEPTSENPSMGIPPYFYQWYFDNSPVSEATNPIYYAESPGNYFVIVTDSLECKGQSSNYYIEILGDNNWQGNAVDIYPNPFINEINVETNSEQNTSWNISDYRGRVLQSGTNHNSWRLNTSELPKGVYILNLHNTNGYLFYKIVKH